MTEDMNQHGVVITYDDKQVEINPLDLEEFANLFIDEPKEDCGSFTVKKCEYDALQSCMQSTINGLITKIGELHSECEENKKRIANLEKSNADLTVAVKKKNSKITHLAAKLYEMEHKEDTDD